MSLSSPASTGADSPHGGFYRRVRFLSFAISIIGLELLAFCACDPFPSKNSLPSCSSVGHFLLLVPHFGRALFHVHPHACAWLQNFVLSNLPPTALIEVLQLLL